MPVHTSIRKVELICVCWLFTEVNLRSEECLGTLESFELSDD